MIPLYKNSPWGRRVKWFLFQRPVVLGPGYNALSFSSSACAPSAGTMVTRCSGQRSPLQVTLHWQEMQKSRNARRRRGGDGIKKHDVFPLFLCPPGCYFQSISVSSYLSLWSLSKFTINLNGVPLLVLRDYLWNWIRHSLATLIFYFSFSLALSKFLPK